MKSDPTSGDKTTLARHEVWRMQYRQRPYLKNTSDDALLQRLKDVMNNLSVLTSDGKLGVLPIGPDGIHWMTLFTHIFEEYDARGGFSAGLSDMPFPKPTAPDIPKSVMALKKIKVPKAGETLIKLGKLSHMKDLIERGRIRIAPARSYSDPSLNYAVNDDELQFDRVMPGSEVTITFLDKQTGEPKDAKPISDVTDTTSLATNFYVYCMTHTLSYRLFDDFEADACVIVREPATFAAKLAQAVQQVLPGWIEWNDEVQYVDPYLHPGADVDLFFSKHFRFWYQQEYRFVWIPEAGGRDSLEPIFVELGPLDGISELVCLSDRA